MLPAEREEALRAALELERAPVPAELGTRMRARLAERLDARALRRGPSALVQLFAGVASAAVGAAIVTSIAHVRAGGSEGPVTRAAPTVVDGPATIAIGDAASATLSRGARLRRAAAGPEVVAGQVELAVHRRAGVAPLVVTAGVSRFTALDARFSVARAASETAVQVAEGAVQVEAGDRQVRLVAGEKWSSAAAAPPLPAEEVAVASLFEQAMAKIESGDFEGARAIYERLSAEEGPTGELGLYSLARLEAERLKQPARALAALEQMERRFADGALERERLLSQIEALQALGRQADARRLSERYAQRYPDLR